MAIDGGGYEMRQGRSFLRALRRAGGVHTLGVFAVFGQLVMMRGSQTGLPKMAKDRAQEGKRVLCLGPTAKSIGEGETLRRRPRDRWLLARRGKPEGGPAGAAVSGETRSPLKGPRDRCDDQR